MDVVERWASAADLTEGVAERLVLQHHAHDGDDDRDHEEQRDHREPLDAPEDDEADQQHGREQHG